MFGKNKGPQSFHITPVQQTEDGPGIMTWAIGIFFFIVVISMLTEGDENGCISANCKSEQFQRDESLNFPEFD